MPLTKVGRDTIRECVTRALNDEDCLVDAVETIARFVVGAGPAALLAAESEIGLQVIERSQSQDANLIARFRFWRAVALAQDEFYEAYEEQVPRAAGPKPSSGPRI